MERLTKKDKFGYWYDDSGNAAIDKLGLIEDLEEEIGIPMQVLFKALKKGIYVQLSGTKTKRSAKDIKLDFYRQKIGNRKIKNFGKTWWLEKTKEEE